MQLRVLGRAEVIAAGGGDIEAAMADIRTSLAQLRAGTAEMPAETSVRLGPPHAVQSRAYALPARVGDHAGVKWTAHHAIDGEPAVVSLTTLSDAMTGRPLGVVESGLLTATRTAATSAFMLQARPPRRIALLGAGVQAAAHLRMLAALFPSLQGVTMWNRSHQRAEQRVRETQAPWPLAAVSDLAVALDGADVVITCTNAVTPLLGPAAMRSGRSLLQIGYHEVEFDAIDRADAVVVDLWGEFRLSSAKSLFQMHRAGRFDAACVAADLAAMALDGWRPAGDAAVYFSSFGLNIFDVALAARVLRIAEQRCLGASYTMLP